MSFVIEATGSPPHPALLAVREIFPGLARAVEDLFAVDDGFRGLCHDYLECVAASRRFSGGGADGEALGREYAALRLRLEVSLLQQIDAYLAV